MSINSQPVSPGRRSLLLVVLLLFFMGSLGVAYGLVLWHKGGGQPSETPLPGGSSKTITYRLMLPDGFEPDDSDSDLARQAVHAFVGYGGKDGKQLRFIYLFAIPVKPNSLNEESLSNAAATFYEKNFEILPQVKRKTKMVGKPAIEVSGKLAPQGFAYLRVAGVEQNLVALLYYGAGNFDANDKEIWGGLTTSLVAQPSSKSPAGHE